MACFEQHLDQIHRCCYSRIFRFHHAVFATIRGRRPCDWIFNGIRWNCATPMDKLGLLLCPATYTNILPRKRLRLEIVSVACVYLRASGLRFRSYRRTYMPSSYHIVQELQKYNIPDYRPRQEQ